jgi:hypothetical protein
MVWSSAEISRIKDIQKMLSTLQIAINNLVSTQQIRQLLLIRQQEINSLKTRAAKLEESIALLQSKIL